MIQRVARTIIIRIFLMSLALVCVPMLTHASEGHRDEPPGDVNPVQPAQKEFREGISEDAALRAEMNGDWEKAAGIYQALLDTKPGRDDLWSRLSDIESRLGHYGEAAEALAKASALVPGNATYLFRLSQIYAVLNRPADALREIEKAVVLEPENIEYLFSRATLASWSGSLESATDSYERILGLSPDNDTAILNLARAYSWKGELDEAVSGYATYMERHPEDREVFIEYVRVEAWRGNYHVALELLEKFRDTFGETTEYQREKARVLAWASRPFQALEIIRPLLEETPDDYEVNYSASIALHYAGRPGDALESLDIIRRLRPDSRETRDLVLFVTTPLRSRVTLATRYYSDSDDLNMVRTEFGGVYALHPETLLFMGVAYDYLRADIGSGLENTDGDEEAHHSRFWIGLDKRITADIRFQGDIGISQAEGRVKVPTYGLKIYYEPYDNFVVSLERQYGYYVISPRSVSLRVRRGMNRLEVNWEPTLRHTIVTSLAFDTFSDDNSRWEVILAPRRSLLRSEKLNLDLGVRGWWFGFENDLNNGYYDPNDYQSYMLTGFGYWKISDENGVSFVASGGFLKDDTMDDFRFGWSADAEGIFGLYRNWMFRILGGVVQNQRKESGAFNAYSVQGSLTRRF